MVVAYRPDGAAAGDGGMAVVMTGVDVVSERLADVRRRIAAAGAEPDRIRIVAVTKGFGPEAVEAARRAGLADCGENYAQELLAKAAAVGSGIRWHFLGPVQRNKVARLAPVVAVWHALDRPAAASAIAAARPGVEVMVQVNATGQAGRAGCRPEDLDALVDHVRRLPVDLTGLMAVGPLGPAGESRRCFRWLAEQAVRLGLPELSMGMSDDFEVAVAEGATILRLGRVLFGARPGRGSSTTIGFDTGGV